MFPTLRKVQNYNIYKYKLIKSPFSYQSIFRLAYLGISCQNILNDFCQCFQSRSNLLNFSTKYKNKMNILKVHITQTEKLIIDNIIGSFIYFLELVISIQFIPHQGVNPILMISFFFARSQFPIFDNSQYEMKIF